MSSPPTFTANTKAKAQEVTDGFSDASTGDSDTDDNSLRLFRAEAYPDFIASGCLWSQSSGLTGSMTLGVVYITNSSDIMVRVSVSAVSSKVFTASKDTYVFIDDTGAITYEEETNGATPPAIPANSIQVAVVITNGSTITQILRTGVRSVGRGEIGRCTLVLDGDEMYVNGLIAKNFLEVDFNGLQSGSNNGAGLRFNGDTGSNYARRYSINGGSDANATSQTSLSIGNGSGGNRQIQGSFRVTNQAAFEKQVQGMMNGAQDGAGNAPVRQVMTGKWVNTSAQISRINIFGTSEDFAALSEMIVYGS